MTVRKVIFHLTEDQKYDIREAVRLAVTYWPNAHLGEYGPREDMRSAFRMIRSHAMHNGDIRFGISALAHDAHRYVDM